MPAATWITQTYKLHLSESPYTLHGVKARYFYIRACIAEGNLGNNAQACKTQPKAQELACENTDWVIPDLEALHECVILIFFFFSLMYRLYYIHRIYYIHRKVSLESQTINLGIKKTNHFLSTFILSSSLERQQEATTMCEKGVAKRPSGACVACYIYHRGKELFH